MADKKPVTKAKTDKGSTRLAQLYNQSVEGGGGTVGSIFSASKERLKEKLDVRNQFGSGLMGSVAKQMFGKGYSGLKQEESPTPVPSGMDPEQAQAMSDDIGILAKNSMEFPGIARDVNVIRQNFVKITNAMLKKDNKNKGDAKSAATKADMYFLKEDEKEAKLESERAKLKGARAPKAAPESVAKKDDGFNIKDFISKIVGWLKDGLFQGLKALFKPSALVKTLGKVFVIGTLIAALVNGIIDGWKTWQETGDLGEAIISGLGGIVDFLTFGIFNKDDIKSVFKKIGDFLDPVIDTIAGVVTTIKDWVVNNVGIPEIKLPTIPEIGFSIPPISVFGKQVFDGKKIAFGPWDLGSVGPWYPFKKNPKSSAPEVTEKPKKKDVAAAPAADKAESAALKKESPNPSPAEVGNTGAPADIGKTQEAVTGDTSIVTQSVSPTKETNQVFIEKANYYQKKRDEAMGLVAKIKKARDQAIKDGASPDEIQGYNNDITKAITAAGDFERSRIETLIKAGETPKPEIKVPDEIKKAIGSEPTQLSTQGASVGGDVTLNAPEGGQPQATRRSSFDRVRLEPKEGQTSEIKNESPSVVSALSDTDAKGIFSESATPTPTGGGGGGGVSDAGAMAPSGGALSQTPSVSAGGSSGGGEAPSLAGPSASSSLPSGETISQVSSEVAEEQRTEMTNSEPTIINNASTSTSNGSTRTDTKTTASVVDDVFAAMVGA